MGWGGGVPWFTTAWLCAFIGNQLQCASIVQEEDAGTASERSCQSTAELSIGSNCPGISGTFPDYKKLARVPERYLKCPGRVLTSTCFTRKTAKEV